MGEQTRFSRFPILEQGNPDRALGAIHVKDLYSPKTKAAFARDLLPLAKRIIYVPETARLERLRQVFLERKVHLAFVVDGTRLESLILERVAGGEPAHGESGAGAQI